MTILENLLLGQKIQEAKDILKNKGYILNEIIETSGRKDKEILNEEIVISVKEISDKKVNLITTKFKLEL